VAPEAPTGQTTSSVLVRTCNSNFPAADSIFQVFSIPDSDQGKCADLSECSVAAQDCADESPCVFDEEFACSNLSPIACEDDSGSCGGDQTRNARRCLTGLTPGDLYYVMVAPKVRVDQRLGDYTIILSAPCSTTLPPMPNDLCSNGTSLSGAPLTVPFDLSGNTLQPQTQAASFDCPAPPCVSLSLKNDIWYDWVAPDNGKVTIDACGTSDLDTPDTGMVVYDGCDCPPGDGAILGCNDFQQSPCALGSKVIIQAIEGHCYKIRLGGHLGGTPAGDLHIQMTQVCELGDCNTNAICDECELDCNYAQYCQGVFGCGQAEDCQPNGKLDSCDIADGTSQDVNPPNGIPDECEPGCSVNLTASDPACDATLPRFQKNTIRLTFDAPIVAPPAGAIEIRELLAGAGNFGATNFAINFIITVEPGNVLKLVENGNILTSGKWYAVMYRGTNWTGVCNFKRDYAKVPGDADNTGINDFADLSFIFGNQTGAATDTNRSDINGDTFVDFADISDAFGFNGSFASGKPSGHACDPIP
jgi:hypothetical protein